MGRPKTSNHDYSGVVHRHYVCNRWHIDIIHNRPANECSFDDCRNCCHKQRVYDDVEQPKLR